MTNQAIHLYEALANLLEYPDREWPAHLELGEQALGAESPELMPDLKEFRRQIDNLSISSLQEQYTRTFDLNPVCNLEIGYHLFGENYKRGIFLANLREMEVHFALNQEQQLPDYLPVLLRLLGKLDDGELRMDLIAECLIPALEKMLEAISQAENSYSHLLRVIAAVLKIEAPASHTRCGVSAPPAHPKRVCLPVLQ